MRACVCACARERARACARAHQWRSEDNLQEAVPAQPCLKAKRKRSKMEAGKVQGREGNVVNEYYTYMKMFLEKPRLYTRKVHFKNKMFGREMAQRGKVLPTKPDNLSSGGGVRSHSVEVLVHDPSTWELRAAEVWGIAQQLSSEHPPISSWGNFSKPGQAR